jgi:hypothetical protein
MCIYDKRPVEETLYGSFIYCAGSVLLSHTVTRAVPWAQTGLTSVFGMGTGVALSL